MPPSLVLAADRSEARLDAIVVTCSSAATRPAAQSLARALQLAFHDSPPPAVGLRLVQTETGLELHDAVTGARLCVEYTAAELRRYRGGTGRDPLRRAIGPGVLHVVDATGGLGRDSVHLAALGYDVTAIERQPIVSALAGDGLRRARASGLLAADNPRWCAGDARTILPMLDPAPATVYLDPMFPPKRKKSAAVRKEMRLLRLLAGDDDGVELLAVARRCARDRVVVKRPIDAPPVAPATIATYRGKLIRYDVYRPL